MPLNEQRGKLAYLYLESHQPSHTIPNRVTQPGSGAVDPLPDQGEHMLLCRVEHCICAIPGTELVLGGGIGWVYPPGRPVDAVVGNLVQTQHAERLLLAAIILAHCRKVLPAARLRMI